MQLNIPHLFLVLLFTFALKSSTYAQEVDPNFIRDEEGKIVLGITCPDKEFKKTRLIVEGIISGQGGIKLSLNDEQKKELDSYMRTYLEGLGEMSTATPKEFAKNLEQKVKEMLKLDKSPKVKLYQFSISSSTFRSRLPKN